MNDAPTGAHIHRADTSIMQALTYTSVPSGGTFGGTLSFSGVIVAPADVAAIAAGQTYINVHTATNTAGAIRGQIQ